jgi:hypothetical protein
MTHDCERRNGEDFYVIQKFGKDNGLEDVCELHL